MVAKTFKGLEGVLADELAALGAEGVKQGVRMVAFTGDKRLMYKANFACRTALAILKPFHTFNAADTDALYDAVRDYDWQQVMSAKQTFAISVTASGEVFRNSQFVTYRVKDGIVDHFTDDGGERPQVRVTNPDVRIDVHIAGDTVTLSLNTSGEPLYRRGWRVAQTDAPINEVLAAGIILMSGWHGERDFVDPMCGSGTFLVEAALIATGTAPGVFGREYAFQRWTDYDAEMFNEIYNDDSGERAFEHKIYGSDNNPKAVAIARKNAKNSSMLRYMEIELRGIETIEQVPEGGIVVTNPPYGKRLGGEDDLQALYRSIGERLKHVFRGYTAWLICRDDRALVRHIGLKPSQRIEVLNGSLECNVLEYVMFDGDYKQMRARGESIRHERTHHAGERAPRPTGERPKERKPRPRRHEDTHSEEYAHRVLRGRKPQLGEDKTVPVMRERRHGWKRRPNDTEGTPENND